MGDAIKLISGGQTGVDRAALDVALTFGLELGGWCPKGRKADDGPIPDKYPLWETRSEEYHVRTQRNVECASATLVITRGAPTGGTRYTVEVAQTMRRPCIVIDLLAMNENQAVMRLAHWLRSVVPRSLNVAGPRESNAPGITEQTCRILARALVDAGIVEPKTHYVE